MPRPRGPHSGALRHKAPGADGVAVLEGNNAGDLVQMGEVMPGPGGEQLGQSHYAQGRVMSAPFEILRTQIQGTQRVQVAGAKTGKLIQHRLEGLAVALAQVRPTIEGRKGLRLASFEDDSGARHPVGAFGVNQVADDLEGAPGVFAFIAEEPGLGQMAKERLERGGGAGEKGQGELQMMLGHSSSGTSRDAL